MNISDAVAAAAEPHRIHILVPTLQGESEISERVTNFLRLQVSATFQEAGTNTRALMIFDPKPLIENTHKAAVSRALLPDVAAHFVLWGQAYLLPDGVAVQAKLSVTPRLTHRYPRPEVWSVEALQAGGGAAKISVALPRETYRFATILISDEAARYYPSIQGMKIYRDRTWKESIGSIGKLFRAYAYHRDAVELESQGIRGWVRLDFINNEQNQIVEFVGGLIRLCRGDWDGAEVLLERLLDRESVTKDLRTDVHLLLGLIEEKRNRSGVEHFRKAVALSSFDRSAVTYLLLGQVADLLRNEQDDEQGRLLALRNDINRHSVLFPPDSKWLNAVNQFVKARSAK
jgi:hypothetical protein